eukprot:6185048-Pleurochrysis_carterae.AAC.3
MAAARMAIAESGMPAEMLASDRAAILVGSAFGGMDTFEKQVGYMARVHATRLDRACFAFT